MLLNVLIVLALILIMWVALRKQGKTWKVEKWAEKQYTPFMIQVDKRGQGNVLVNKIEVIDIDGKDIASGRPSFGLGTLTHQCRVFIPLQAKPIRTIKVTGRDLVGAFISFELAGDVFEIIEDAEIHEINF